jgi:thioredoxin-dependent peroxiredoxin
MARFARTMPRVIVRAFALAAPLALVLACQTPEPTPTSASATAPAPSATPVASGPAGASAAPAAAPSPAASTAQAGDAPASDDLVGKVAPDFTATAQNGTSVHLAALKGKPVVLYFYPKDETAGCTKEACSFRDSWKDIEKTGAVLIGVSADTLDSHKGFAANHQLPFLLLSDPDGALGSKFGVPFGTPFPGHHQRQTVVIGADGKVIKVYRKVDVTQHAAQVLEDLGQHA